ncbi:MAG: type I polyketide synthase [Candidatus Hinthialibacter antarcticus]|nr:type I polyketide synthase [Candidatus Hinthialibacter antarcticus]
MNQPAETNSLSPLKRALVAMETLQAKIDALEQQRAEPIAVIGMACRFPGAADSPEAFWRNLKAGVHSVSEIPASRWDIDDYYDPDPETPGKMNTRHGGFIDHVEEFDAPFFSISPREAITMDPQQRILLETAFQAMQDAGMVRERLSGQLTGAFIGVTSNDHSQINLETGDVSNIDTYHITGNTNNAAAGRLSYVMGLRGPCMAIDTACSSSLTAMHQAVRSLQNRECDAALTGGVNLMLSPVTNLALSKTKVLSPSGCCRAFDDGADGMVRGEGCGVVVLKRLSDAQADGDRILAVVRGSAVNQDGPSSGLTVPNGPAQEALIRSALKHAGLNPEEIDYIEAHGTGTSLGDPIELKALANAYASSRPVERPLLIGSVKTNIGHLEAGAGIAGFIKLVLALQHEELPPHLHFEQPTSRFDWQRFSMQVVKQATAWKRGERPRRCGVSSFGFSGVNAHVIVEEAPLATQKQTQFERPVHTLVCSAHSEEALRAAVENLLGGCEALHENQWADVCYSSNGGRGHFAHRLAVSADNLRDGRAQLQAWLDGASCDVACNRVERAPKIAFLFTGQGAQYPQMARQLFDSHPAFRETMETCDRLLRDRLPQPLLEVLYGAQSGDGSLNQTEFTQPALFALEYSLAKLWQSWGVAPSFVAGHSVGEYAAACFAGIFSLEDGVQLIAERARLIQSVQAPGAMLALSCDETTALELIQPYQDVSIAALNSPTQTVVSGGERAIKKIQTLLKEKKIHAVPLRTSHAFHSPLMDEILPQFETYAKQVAFTAPKTAMVSNGTGALADHRITTAQYWTEHIRKPVRFMDGMRALEEKGADTFVEIGPKPLLVNLGQACVNPDGKTWLASLRKEGRDWQDISACLGALYINGAKIDWRGFDRGYSRNRLSLPTYPFQRQRYWVRDEASHQAPRLRGRASQTFLGERMALAGSEEMRFESRISIAAFPFLADHKINSRMVLPLSAFIDIAASASKQITGATVVRIENLSMMAPCVLDENAESVLQTVAQPIGEGRYSFCIYSSRGVEDSEWLQHAVGEFCAGEALDAPSLKVWSASEESESLAQAHYQACRSRGVDFGPAFQAVHALQLSDGRAQSIIDAKSHRPAKRCFIDPVLLDACFQTLGAFVLEDNAERLFLPVGIERIELRLCEDRNGYAQATHVETGADADSIVFDFEMLSSKSEAVASIHGMRLKEAPSDFLLKDNRADIESLFYHIEWTPFDLPQNTTLQHKGRWLVVSEDAAFCGAAKKHLQQHGGECECVTPHQLLQPQFDLKRFGRMIIYCTDDEAQVAQVTYQYTAQLVQIIQRLLKMEASAPLFVMTQNAQCVSPDDDMSGLAQAPLWGVLKCLMQEHPNFSCAMIDVDDVASSVNWQALAQILCAPINENQLGLREGKCYAARMARHQLDKNVTLLSIKPDKAYLITGGLRGIGFAVAGWMVERGATHLVLASRSGKIDAAQERRINDWKQRGVHVYCARCDVSIAQQVQALVENLPQGFPALGGVVHSAGVLDDASIVNLNEERIQNVFAPKVNGAVNLHQATQTMELDFFVLFSSLSTLWGSQGQANYVAANSFLDGFAHWRRAKGLPALCVNWGPWQETGMAANDALLAQFESQGIRALPNERGLAALGRLLDAGAVQCAVADIDWPRLLQRIGSSSVPPLLADIANNEKSEIAVTSQASSANVLDSLLSQTGDQRRQRLSEYLTQRVIAVLRIQPAEFDERTPLNRLGVDSLMAVELRNRLQKELKVDAPIPMFLDGSDTHTLVDRIAQRFEQAHQNPSVQPTSKQSVAQLADNLDSTNAEHLLDKIDDLSDEEIDALFGSAVKDMKHDTK